MDGRSPGAHACMHKTTCTPYAQLWTPWVRGERALCDTRQRADGSVSQYLRPELGRSPEDLEEPGLSQSWIKPALRPLNGSSVGCVRVVPNSLWPSEVEAAYSLRVTECAGAGPMTELIPKVKKSLPVLFHVWEIHG